MRPIFIVYSLPHRIAPFIRQLSSQDYSKDLYTKVLHATQYQIPV